MPSRYISVVAARIAQSVEHQTFNLRVQGSSPCSGAAFFTSLLLRIHAVRPGNVASCFLTTHIHFHIKHQSISETLALHTTHPPTPPPTTNYYYHFKGTSSTHSLIPCLQCSPTTTPCMLACRMTKGHTVFNGSITRSVVHQPNTQSRSGTGYNGDTYNASQHQFRCKTWVNSPAVVLSSPLLHRVQRGQHVSAMTHD